MAAYKFHHSQHHKLGTEERERMLPVSRVLKALEPLVGLTIIDVGCGKGYFALPFARAVGPDGHVHAVDTSREMLALLQEAAASAANLTPVLSQETAIPLEDGLGDILFSSTVYHEFEDRPGMLREMQRLARPGARHVVIDWNRQSGEHGPPLEHRIGEETVVGEYAALGMELKGRFQPGSNFYGLIFREGKPAG